MNHKVLIETVFERSYERFYPPFLKFLKNKNIVQTKPVRVGFKIKNIGNDPIRGFTISGIRINSAHGQDISSSIDNSFHIDTLNPGSSVREGSEKFGAIMYGLVNVRLNISPDSPEDTIETYQKIPYTKEISKYRQNSWCEFIYIKSNAEDVQEFNNFIIILLTIMTVAIALVNLRYYVRYQVKPAQDEQQLHRYEARTYCEGNHEGQWPKTNGGFFSCDQILEITKNDPR